MKTKISVALKSIHQNDPRRTSKDAPTAIRKSSCQCQYYQGASCAKCAPKISQIPDLFIMENGEKFSSGWLSQAIWGNFKKPLDPTKQEVEVHDYILRRVNQGTEFDVMFYALKEIATQTTDGDTVAIARAALKLAQEVR